MVGRGDLGADRPGCASVRGARLSREGAGRAARPDRHRRRAHHRSRPAHRQERPPGDRRLRRRQGERRHCPVVQHARHGRSAIDRDQRARDHERGYARDRPLLHPKGGQWVRRAGGEIRRFRRGFEAQAVLRGRRNQPRCAAGPVRAGDGALILRAMRDPRAKEIFAPEFAAEPLWWQDAPPDAANRPPLPARVDVAVIGGGYCGLGAALELARAGAGVAVLDIGAPGEGASTRNGGMVGGAVKLDWSRLAARFGAPTAAALLDGARASFEHLENLIAREGFDADYRRCGRFMLACNRAHYRALQREVDALGERARSVQIVPRERQRQQIGSDFYHGGVVVEESGGLHPAKLHRALRAAAKTAGAELHAHAEVQHLEPAGNGMALVTARGRIRAGQVVVAANGYTGALLPGLRRRVVPVSSYIIVTEPLPPELPERLSPRGRMFVDSNRLLSYFRLSPDGRRVVFCGRLQLRTVDERT